MNKILLVLIWLVVGLVTYLWFYAPTPFDWSQPWVYIIMVAWPLAWLYEIAVILFWIAVVILVVLGVCFIAKEYLS